MTGFKIKRLKKPKSQKRQTGAAVVEAAFMLPLLLITTFGAIDVAQYINAAQVVSNSSREGARISSRNGTEHTDEVRDVVLNYLADAFPHLSPNELEESVAISVQQSGQGANEIPNGDLTLVTSGDPLVVTVDFDFDAVRWLGGFAYFDLTTGTHCRRE